MNFLAPIKCVPARGGAARLSLMDAKVWPLFYASLIENFAMKSIFYNDMFLQLPLREN